MYNQNHTQFVGRHDYDGESAKSMAGSWANSFSIGIFKWEMNSSGKAMKRGKVIVRVSGPCSKEKDVFSMAENVVKMLDNGDWDGRKTVKVK